MGKIRTHFRENMEPLLLNQVRGGLSPPSWGLFYCSNVSPTSFLLFMYFGVSPGTQRGQVGEDRGLDITLRGASLASL